MNTPTPVEPTRARGLNFLLVGATGSGKTHSAIRTLAQAGVEVFALFTEPGYQSVVNDIPAEQLKYHYIAPASPDWDTMISSARKINTMSFEALAKLSNIDKSKYGQFIDMLNTCHNFVDDRTGDSYGDITTWGPQRAFVLDSLSGVNIAAMNLVVGSKPTKSMSDWGTAMDNLERFIQKLCVDTNCHFVLTAHLERETDEVTGAVQLMASTLGRKLAPRIPRFFDDVVHTIRDGDKFRWSTASLNVDLKARDLPISDQIIPSFVPVIEQWRRANGLGAEPSE